MKLIKSSFLLLLLAQGITLVAQNQKYVLDTTSQGNKMLFGEVSAMDFMQSPFIDWYDKNINEYTVDDIIKADKVVKALSKYDITIYMGTWCGDSRKEVPRVIKALEAANYNMDKLTIHTLNQSKQGRNREDLGQNIHRVPSIVFSKNGKEKGRIVEHPIETIEKDIYNIVASKNYRPNYYGLEVLHQKILKKGFDIINNEKLISNLKNHIERDYELYKYGVIYFRNDEFDKAIAIYDLNAKIFPESDRPYQNKGISYYLMEDFENSKINLKKSLEMNPENKYAQKYLKLIADKENISVSTRK